METQSSKTIQELILICKSLGIKGYSNKRKADIIHLIETYHSKKDVNTEVSISTPVSAPVSAPAPVPDKYPKPFLKWVGGKTQILEKVLELFPKVIHHYHEPFLGGGSVLLGLLAEKQRGHIQISGSIYASDINPLLIGLYRNIQQNIEEFIHNIRCITKDYLASSDVKEQEKYYYQARTRFNEICKEQYNSLEASALFLFLNKTCFRGVYREGPRGFNVPYGHYNEPSIFCENHLRSISSLIQDVLFVVQPYTESFTQIAHPTDFIYLDPPYAPINETSFVSYTAHGFTHDDHRQLFKLCHQVTAQHSARLVMSNSDVASTRSAFPSPPYTKQVISCRRAINSKDPSSRIDEVLISNF